MHPLTIGVRVARGPLSRNRRPMVMTAVMALGLLLVPGIIAAEPRPLEFHITFDASVSPLPFTGRVYVMLSKRPIEGVHAGINWFQPEPLFAQDVKNWKPGEPTVLGADALGHPCSLSKLPKGTYWVQAVMDFDRGGKDFSSAEGNGYSKAVNFELDVTSSGPINLVINQIVASTPFRETERIK